jgi:hypothetical protein
VGIRVGLLYSPLPPLNALLSLLPSP